LRLSLVITTGIVAGAVAFWVFSKPTNLHGDARWAHRGEVAEAKMLRQSGILVGKLGGRYLQNDEPIHALVAAPTRSGKGVGIVIPCLLNWSGSVVVLDIKHENFELTSGFRGKSQGVFMWSPMDDDGRSHRFNPLDLVRPTPPHRVGDLQRMGAILIPQTGSDPMWSNEARDLFVAVALWVLDDEDAPSTFGEIYRFLKGGADLAEVALYVIKYYASSLDPAARMSLANFAGKAEKERSGVKSNLTSALSLWANPTIDAATSASDFDPRQLRRQGTSIYVGVKKNQLASLRPLLGLFFQLVVDALSGEMPQEDEKHEVLMVLDEFASLGRMDTLADGLAFLAGYKIRIITIIQGLGQLDEIYGRGRENFLQNSAIQVFFASNDETTTQYVSRRLGTKTITTTSKSVSGKDGPFGAATRSTSSMGAPFMPPEKVRLLDKRSLIVFKEGERPILGRKILYWKNRDFKKRLLDPVKVPELKIAYPENRAIVPTKALVISQTVVGESEEVDDVAGELADILGTLEEEAV